MFNFRLYQIVPLFALIIFVVEIHAQPPEQASKDITPSLKLASATNSAPERAKEIFKGAFELFQEGQMVAAEIQFKKGLEVDPNSGIAHYYLAEIQTRLNKPDEAIKHYEAVIELAPDSKEAALVNVTLSQKRADYEDRSRKVAAAQAKVLETQAKARREAEEAQARALKEAEELEKVQARRKKEAEELEKAEAMARKEAEEKARIEEVALAKKKQEKMVAQAQAAAEARNFVFRDCDVCPEMAVIPPGEFLMGGSNNDLEKPIHSVAVDAFAIGKSEVTQGQWREVMKSNPSQNSSCGDDCPVENVSWNDAQVFIQKLNAKTGKEYRLPSEAEWEYACRSFGQHEYCGSDFVDQVAWYKENSDDKTHPVGRKKPNDFGLYDMSGNVSEWVEDNFHNNYGGAPTNGSSWKKDGTMSGPWQLDGTKLVLRGGGKNTGLSDIRAASRGRSLPEETSNALGFRVARMLSLGEPELIVWNKIKDSSEPSELKEFLERFPNGKFAEIAKKRILGLAKLTIYRVSAFSLMDSIATPDVKLRSADEMQTDLGNLPNGSYFSTVIEPGFYSVEVWNKKGLFSSARTLQGAKPFEFKVGLSYYLSIGAAGGFLGGEGWVLDMKPEDKAKAELQPLTKVQPAKTTLP